MTALSQAIFDRWQVRKTKTQKTAFIDFLQSQLPELKTEESKFPNNRNLVLGDVKSAKILLTAHYDTCARLPFPNFITPKNIPVYLAYQLLITLPFLALFVLIMTAIIQLTGLFWLGYWCGFLAMMGSMFWVTMGGPANLHTANDNTSGVITLCEIYAKLTEEQKKHVCLVFFDNEENGLLGSSAFAKRHKKDGLKEKLVLNFDCVSDGDHFLLVQNPAAEKKFGSFLAGVFSPTEEKQVHFASSSRALYPSDQKNFPVNAAVAALKHHKLVGLYMDKIHTMHDTRFDESNIAFLTERTCQLVSQL